MKKLESKVVMKSIAKVCEKMAYSVSASACMWGAYQPKQPKSLNK